MVGSKAWSRLRTEQRTLVWSGRSSSTEMAVCRKRAARFFKMEVPGPTVGMPIRRTQYLTNCEKSITALQPVCTRSAKFSTASEDLMDAILRLITKILIWHLLPAGLDSKCYTNRAVL